MFKELTERLRQQGVSETEFQELMVRLMHYGVLVRAESQIEQQLYDRFLQCMEEVRDALSVCAVSLFHDSQLHYVRLYPPGAHVPGQDDADQDAWSGGLRRKLGQHEVALVLVLRLLYDQDLREGRVDDQGCVAQTLETIGLQLRQRLQRGLPEQASQRLRVFQRLRQLRLIAWTADADLEQPQTVVRIHPMIRHFVNDAALHALAPVSDHAPGQVEAG